MQVSCSCLAAGNSENGLGGHGVQVENRPRKFHVEKISIFAVLSTSFIALTVEGMMETR